MSRYIQLFVVVSLLLFVSVSISGSSCGISRKIWTINGIWTSDIEASRNMLAIKKTYGLIYAGQPVDYAYAYNDGNGLFDLYFQKDIEADPVKSRKLALALLSIDFSELETTLADKIKADYVEALGNYPDVNRIGVVVAKISNLIVPDIAAGVKVVLCPHSQGAIYANEVFKVVAGDTPSTDLKIVAAGSAASYVMGDTAPYASYVTTTEDNAIALLTLKYPTTLKPTVTAGTPVYWPFAHSFTDVYVNPGYKAWPQLKQKIDAAMGGLQPSDAVMVSAIWNPAITSIELQMLINGMKTEKGISSGAGWATYCSDFTSSAEQRHTPMLYNRGALPATVTLLLPSSNETVNLSAASSIFPSVYMGTTITTKYWKIL